MVSPFDSTVLGIQVVPYHNHQANENKADRTTKEHPAQDGLQWHFTTQQPLSGLLADGSYLGLDRERAAIPPVVRTRVAEPVAELDVLM